MTPRVLFDYATNTGHFYNRHLRLARDAAPVHMWARYIRADLLPYYRREQHEPFDGMSCEDIDTLASKLMDYYANHIMESDADA
jgi:hypothetical protein